MKDYEKIMRQKMKRNKDIWKLDFFRVLLLIVWWVSIGIIYYTGNTVGDFVEMVNNGLWVPANIIGLISITIWIFVVIARYKIIDSISKFNNFARTMLIIGLIWYACIQYYETFLWPVIAYNQPSLMVSGGALLGGDLMIFIPLILSGIVLFIGYLLTGIVYIKEASFSKILVVIDIVGVTLFALGMGIIIRSIGLLIHTITTVLLHKSLIGKL